MNTLKISADGLWTEALNYLVPHQGEKAELLIPLFNELTDKKNIGAEVFSGYRFRTLERFGLEDSKTLAARLRQEFDTMLVLGIGGSALGARSVINALSWTVPQKDRRTVLIADNLDPIEFEELWAQCVPAKTVVVIISKSGGTIETMAQASCVIDRFQSAQLSLSKHIVTITDPTGGALRKWTESAGLSSLAVPNDVGGRFSVLTPVGLLPIAFRGISVDDLCEGAVDFFSQRQVNSLLVAKMGLRIAELEAGSFCSHTLMPYSTKLKDFGAWFVQLWGESLGKTRPGLAPTGLIPVAAVGATDQHSLLQLLVEGPNRNITGFVRVDEWPQTGNKRPMMHKLPPEFASLSFAHAKTFPEILNAEASATRQVLQDKQRPVYELRLNSAGAHSVGALLAFYMDLVTYTAVALKINPYNQPGVEYGKMILPKLLQ